MHAVVRPVRHWLKCAVSGLTLTMLGVPWACSSDPAEEGDGASVSSNQPDGDGGGSGSDGTSSESLDGAVNSNQASSMSEDEELGFTDISTTEIDAGIGMLGDGESCAGETRAAESIDLDIHLMVDISGSMTDILPDSGTTKWDAVNAALQEFVQSPETADIGIGISYFPLLKDGVPDSCSNNDQCGDAGPCTNSQCVIPVEFADGTESWIQSLDEPPANCAEDGC